MPYTYEFARPSLAVDVVVVAGEPEPQLLLIRRKHEPFAGMWALPGGYVNENESLDKAARRELEEETGLKISSLEQFITMGDPGRDPRGWTISVVYLARLGREPQKAQAADDAAEAQWFPLQSLPKLAFDHQAIVELLSRRLGTK